MHADLEPASLCVEPRCGGACIWVPPPRVPCACLHAHRLGVQTCPCPPDTFPRTVCVSACKCVCVYVCVCVCVSEGLTVNTTEAEPAPHSCASSSSPVWGPSGVCRGARSAAGPMGGAPVPLTSASLPGRESAGAWGRKGAPHSGVREALRRS